MYIRSRVLPIAFFPNTKNESLAKFKIIADKKGEILEQLHRLNINQFTIYNNLDHLSKDITLAWKLRPLR